MPNMTVHDPGCRPPDGLAAIRGRRSSIGAAEVAVLCRTVLCRTVIGMSFPYVLSFPFLSLILLWDWAV
jgi:hypothetical protein